MFYNYLKIALRNIKRYKGYAAINISGLAAGIACFIFIMLWVQHETSFEKFHDKANSIYRVLLYYPDSDGYSWAGPGPLAGYLKSNYPEIVNGSMVFSDVNRPLKHGDKLFSATLCGCEPSFFEIFSFDFLEGGLESSFSNPNYIILTEETARKYFGEQSPLGATMALDWWGRWLQFEVTGVIEDVPQNSHLQFDFVLPFDFVTASGMTVDDWGVRAYKAYVTLDPNVGAIEVTQKIAEDLRRHDPDSKALLRLQPVTDIHLRDPGGGGPITYVYTFSLLGMLILLIACINFMNLASARSLTRAKEISLRKVVGSTRTQVMRQCFVESNLFSLSALLLATFFVFLALPAINSVVGVNLELSLSPSLILQLTAVSLFAGTLSGAYPAFVLAKFQPVKLMKGIDGSTHTVSALRKMLVTAQFTVSIVLIICALVVSNQLRYLQEKNLGFDKNYILNLEMGGAMYPNYPTLREKLEAHADILSVTRTNFSFSKAFGTSGISWEGKEDNENVFASMHSVDYNFLEFFDIEMAEGRFFSDLFPTDASEALVLNETAVREFGIKDPVGKYFFCPLPLNMVRDGSIIGVVKDFNYSSLRTQIKPLILAMVPYWYSDVYIRLRATNIPATIAYIEKILQEIDPDYLFEYRFMDEEIGRLYITEQRMATLIHYGTFWAIFISCLGLFGLASFTVSQRRKEIGIRKVLGASVPSVLSSLLAQFIKWVMLGNILAWPLAYGVMSKWLQNFEYKIDISVRTFLFATLITVAIATFTVSFQSLRAAASNPVDSLKYE